MDSFKQGWFTEENILWPGHCLSLKVEEVLHKERSNYQDILVVKTKSHGIALILDGIIQCTEHDEFSYQEMAAFLPLCSHPNPSKVLVVGGGDGGVVREVSKHPLVKEIVQVEIDERVIEVCKKFLPFMAVGFSSQKLTLKICDGFEYIRQNSGQFDVIITDSSDPIGPASNLFTESYFGLLKKALKPNGIVCSQAGAIWENPHDIRNLLNACKQHFDVAKYAVVSVPTYPTGQIGFIVATSDKTKSLSEPYLQTNLMNLNYRLISGTASVLEYIINHFPCQVNLEVPFGTKTTVPGSIPQKATYTSTYNQGRCFNVTASDIWTMRPNCDFMEDRYEREKSEKSPSRLNLAILVVGCILYFNHY